MKVYKNALIYYFTLAELGRFIFTGYEETIFSMKQYKASVQFVHCTKYQLSHFFCIKLFALFTFLCLFIPSSISDWYQCKHVLSKHFSSPNIKNPSIRALASENTLNILPGNGSSQGSVYFNSWKISPPIFQPLRPFLLPYCNHSKLCPSIYNPWWLSLPIFQSLKVFSSHISTH